MSFFTKDFSQSFFNEKGEVNDLSFLSEDILLKESELGKDGKNETENVLEEAKNVSVNNEETMNYQLRDIKRPEIHNVVATVDMKTKVDCKKVAQMTRNSKYNPKRFPAVILHLKQPQTTAFVFSTGKLTVLGAKTIEKSKLASRRFARIVQKVGYPDVKWSNFKVANMVASCDVGFKINLEGLAIDHSLFCTYEPELFPGAIYKMLEPKATLLIFVSGKIVITSKSEEIINEAFDIIRPILISYRQTIL